MLCAKHLMTQTSILIIIAGAMYYVQCIPTFILLYTTNQCRNIFLQYAHSQYTVRDDIDINIRIAGTMLWLYATEIPQ